MLRQCPLPVPLSVSYYRTVVSVIIGPVQNIPQPRFYLASAPRLSVRTRLSLLSPTAVTSSNGLFIGQHYLTFSVCLQWHWVLALHVYVVRSASESISMEMLKIEQVIVGGGMRSTSAETKPESEVIPPQSCKLELL